METYEDAIERYTNELIRVVAEFRRTSDNSVHKYEQFFAIAEGLKLELDYIKLSD